MAEQEYFSQESILIITEKGILKRLKTPFRVLLIVRIEELKENETYLVTAVIINIDMMMYGIKGNLYFYNWFIIIG